MRQIKESQQERNARSDKRQGAIGQRVGIRVVVIRDGRFVGKQTASKA